MAASAVDFNRMPLLTKIVPRAYKSIDIESRDSKCLLCFQKCFHKTFCSRHNITWLLLLVLVGGIGLFLLIYAVPLVDKAHKVADEALDITSLAREKLESIDKQVGDFLQGGNEKFEQVGDFLQGGNEKLEQVGDAVSDVRVLTVRLHTVIDQLNATVLEAQQNTTALEAQLPNTPPTVDGAPMPIIPSG